MALGSRNFRRLIGASRPYRGRLVAGIAAGLVVGALWPVMPILTRAVIDQAIVPRRTDRLWQLLVVVGLVGVVRAVFFGLRRQLAGAVSVDVEADLRERLYEHVQALDMGYHERVSTGQLMSRGSSDLQAVRQLYMMLPWGFTLTLLVAGAIGVTFALDWRLAAACVWTLIPLAWSVARFVRRFDPVVLELQQRLAELSGVVEETVTGIRVVKAFGREAAQVAKLEREAARIYGTAMRSIRLRADIVSAFTLLPNLSVVAAVWYGGHSVLRGDLTIGTLVAFNAYLAMLVFPLRALGMIVAAGQRATSAAGRIFEVLDTRPGIADRPGARKLEADRGHLRFEDVHFAYPDGGPVLDGVWLDVPGGTSLALVGPTGCGKSTLTRLIGRFIEPARGRVLVDETDVAAVTLRSLRSRIGMVFEETFLFSDTIRANIAFGRPDAGYDQIVEAAVTAQAHEFICELPDGYESVVGEQGYTLSGGQRQRIAIARAVLLNPRVLILDDATSSVDARVESAIREGLRKAMAGRTTLIVARRPSTAALADRVAYMEAGRIVTTGTHDELWRTEPRYRAALETAAADLREVS